MKEHLVSNDELTLIALEHVAIVKSIAEKFNGNWLSKSIQIKDYREYLDEMNTHLKRAEALAEEIPLE